jgi:methyltransferase (TIGR00027 family)
LVRFVPLGDNNCTKNRQTRLMADTPSPFAHRLQDRPSLTAEAVTIARALEHLKPEDQRVVDDPWADLFLSRASRAALRAWSGSLTGRALRRLGVTGTTWVPLRHRFIDDHLTALLDAGAVQVVLLGAGYDMRAYRFAERLAGRPVFEVDLPAISRNKAAIIEHNRERFPTTNVVRVEIDFERQSLADVLVDAGFVAGGLTFVTWEGVPMYLTRAAVKATLDAVHTVTAPGSVIAHDMWTVVDDPGPMGTARRLAPNALSFIGEPITFCVHPEEIGDFYGRRGFDIVEIASGDELLSRYTAGDQRALVDPSVYALAARRR